MIRCLYITLVVLLFASCKKEVAITDESDFEMEITRDEFSDTIYWINNLNVVSTNDSVIDHGVFRLTDAQGNVIFENNWQEARNYSFGLPLRKEYKLHADLFLSGEDTLSSEEIIIDNNDYPDAIKLNSIEIDGSVLNNDGTYYVSSSHVTLVSIYYSLDALFDSDNYDVDLATVFYQKQFSPQTTTYNFNNFELPTRSISREWRGYEVRVGYPLVYGPSGSSVINDREVMFYVDVENLVKNGNSTAGITLYKVSDDSNEGGIYTGTIEYEWIYND